MRKGKAVIVLLLSSFILAGCKDKKDTPVVDNTENTFVLNENQVKVEKLEPEKDAFEYHYETDDVVSNDYFHEFALGSKAAYFWEKEGSGRLMFYDYESKVCAPLCSKANCTHMDKMCNAYFNSMNEDGDITYMKSFIQVIENYIFVLGRTEEGMFSLYRVSEDGSSCERYMDMFRIDIDPQATSLDVRYPELLIHRGYLYYMNNMEEGVRIRRQKLGTNESEVIFYNEGERADTYRMMAVGDYLFFQSGCFVNDEYIEIEGGIWAYNINTEQTKFIADNAYAMYRVANGKLYYLSEKAIHELDLVTGEKREVLSGIAGNSFSFYVNKDAMYICDYSGTLAKYDMNGKLLGKIKVENADRCLYMDEKYIVEEVSTGGELYKCDKNIICVDEVEWN